jgi:hypothetical protein
MRAFERPPVICACGAKIYTESIAFRKSKADPVNDVRAKWPDPPASSEPCPKCGQPVDTTAAFPYLAGFPPSFDDLKAEYGGFAVRWEMQRQSFDEVAARAVKSHGGLAPFVAFLNTSDGRSWHKQRMFYRSSVAFYRSLQLFLGYLTLDQNCFKTWAEVTGYYSRFYFIQAFLNLCLCTHLSFGKKATIFFDGKTISCVLDKDLSKGFCTGSHEIWWSLLELVS